MQRNTIYSCFFWFWIETQSEIAANDIKQILVQSIGREIVIQTAKLLNKKNALCALAIL